MQNAGWIISVLLFVVAIANAQPGSPELPKSTSNSALSNSTDPKLNAHFDAWEKAMNDVKSVRCEFTLERTDSVFKRTKKYDGALTIMKPNLFVLRLNNQHDPTGKDFEEYICDGKSVFYYNGLLKTVTEYRLRIPTNNINEQAYAKLLKFLTFKFNLLLEKVVLLSGTNPKDLRERFEIALYKEDANYIFLRIKPHSDKEADFQLMNLALFGPKTEHPYCLSQINIQLANDDSEIWKFSGIKKNSPEVVEASFRLIELPGFKVLKALKEPEPTPKIDDPQKPEPINPENPPAAIAVLPVLCPALAEFPTYCCEKPFRWRLLRNCR